MLKIIYFPENLKKILSFTSKFRQGGVTLNTGFFLHFGLMILNRFPTYGPQPEKDLFFDNVSLKPTYSATKTSWNIEILYGVRLTTILSR